MTADAVRAAGGGSVNERSKTYVRVMNKLEAEGIMAVEQTQVLPAPVLEAALTAFTKKLPSNEWVKAKFNTAAYDPQVAEQTNTLQTGADSSSGLGV